MPKNESEEEISRKEHDKRLKSDEKDRLLKKHYEFKDEYNAVVDREKELKKADSIKVPNDPQGKTYWQVVEEKADQLCAKNFAGYNDWAIGMMDLMYAGLDLAKAMWYDPINPIEVLSRPLPYREDISAGIKQGTNALWRRIIKPIDKILLASDSKLPQFTFTAEMNEQGKVKTAAYRDHEFAPELAQYMDTGLIAWARSQDYDYQINPATNSVQFRNVKNGDEMSQDTFNNLANDPETGLETFLSGRFNVNMKYEPSQMGP